MGTSGDYAPFSTLDPSAGRDGFDVALARAWARDRGLRLEWVAFRWPELAADLAAGRFDVAMGGVTVRPERSATGRFGIPVATTGAVVLVPASGHLDLPDLDAPEVRLAVNAGGHLERATRARFPRASILAVSDNGRVLDALRAGLARGVVTDRLEAVAWRERWAAAGGETLRALGPFSRDRKAPWWRIGEDERARDLDRWLLEAEARGELEALRQRYLGADAGGPVARPWPAVVAAIDERLALMPAVAAAKRRREIPIEAPEVEARVVAAGVAAVGRECAAAGRPAPEPAVGEAVYRALIEAAKAIQAATPADTPADLDLEREIRPALLRIGDKLAFLLARLPGPGMPPDAGAISEALASDTALGTLDRRHADSLARALERFAAGAPAPGR